MAKEKKKQTRPRAGTRKQAPHLAARLLIAALFRRLGGFSRVAMLLENDRQLPHKWSTQGYVPLGSLTEVSKTLELDPWALNYIALSEMLPDDAPAWKEVVTRAKLDSITTRAILAYPAPTK